MNLPKGLYKRGSCYYLDYKDETGRRIRRSAGPDLHHALELLHKVRGPDPSKDGTSLKQVVDSYPARLRVYSKRKSVSNAESSIRRLIEHFGDPQISDFSEQLMTSFVQKRRMEGVVDKTINGDLIIMRAALNHAAGVGLVHRLPLRIKLLKTPKRRIGRILTPEEIKRLLCFASGRIFGILLVAAHTGFRTDEILHLQWRDVGWEERSLRVTSKQGIWSSKNHQERSVFVSEPLIAWLRQHRSSVLRSEDRDWIFSTRNSTPMSVFSVCRAVRKVFERAGLYQTGSPTIHLIRHSVASRLLQGGADLETVRDWLGHADVSTTSVYLHTTSERKRAAALLLGLPS